MARHLPKRSVSRAPCSQFFVSHLSLHHDATMLLQKQNSSCYPTAVLAYHNSHLAPRVAGLLSRLSAGGQGGLRATPRMAPA